MKYRSFNRVIIVAISSLTVFGCTRRPETLYLNNDYILSKQAYLYKHDTTSNHTSFKITQKNGLHWISAHIPGKEYSVVPKGSILRIKQILPNPPGDTILIFGIIENSTERQCASYQANIEDILLIPKSN